MAKDNLTRNYVHSRKPEQVYNNSTTPPAPVDGGGLSPSKTCLRLKLHHPFPSKHRSPDFPSAMIRCCLLAASAFSHILLAFRVPSDLLLASAATVLHGPGGIKVHKVRPLTLIRSLLLRTFCLLDLSTMRGIVASSIALYAASSAFGALIPYSELKARTGYSTPLADCLHTAGLNPVVEGDSAYATDSAPFNLR